MDDEIVFDRYDPRERRWHRRLWRWAWARALWWKLLCVFAIMAVGQISGLAYDPNLRWFYRIGVVLLFGFVLGPPAWGWWQVLRPRRSRRLEEP